MSEITVHLNDSTVVCEADTDCRFYSMVFDAELARDGHYSQARFVPTGGKDKLAEVVSALRPMGIECVVVPDLDILNEKAKIKRLVETCGGAWKDMKDDYDRVASHFATTKQKMPLRATIKGVLDASADERLTHDEIQKIRETLSIKSRWGDLKAHEVDAVTGESRKHLDSLMNRLRATGIHAVPCGELERFVPDVGGHGTSWLSNVLQQHPNLDDTAYDTAKEFVTGWGI